MRVLVCGGRSYQDYDQVSYRLSKLGATTVISGHAKGADSLGEMWAEQYGADLLVFPADWEKHGKAAGAIRNTQMLNEGKPDLVLAFPGGRGTANMVMQARRRKIPVVEIDEDGWIKDI